MKKKGRNKSGEVKRKTSKLSIIIASIAGALALLILVVVFLIPALKNNPDAAGIQSPNVTPIAVIVETEAPVPSTEPTAKPTAPVETEPPVMLPEMAEIYAENPDLAGWITIEGTILDYPVMYTPYDEEKYLYKNIKEHFDLNGLPFIEDACSLNPESDNIIIYGHNMNSGRMFASLMNYERIEYWEEHPIIKYTTLYEEREYEIVAAFRDRVYYKYEDCFKFYKFIDAEDEAHFEKAITYFKEKAPYDTGVSAEYGDHLITLVTCAYHESNGRFVVVAREITPSTGVE